MFEGQFYPTPRAVLDRMSIDCHGKKCLEPSAGKGDIVNYLREFGAAQILAAEKNPDLRKILSGTCEIIADDFFSVTGEQVSHVQLIVMNPPFNKAADHILHAWEIAPEGCEIIALCNWQTIEKRGFHRRRELGNLVDNYGNSENLGDCFSAAERKTDVEVGLVHLFKPALSSGFDFDGFYFTEEDNTNANGLIPYNEVRAIVNSYVAAVKCFDRFREIADEMNNYTKLTNFGYGFSFSVQYSSGASEGSVATKDECARAMQKHCWKHIFNRMQINKYVTKGVMKDINQFVENQQAYPFTMRNVYRMIEIVVGTRENTMNRAIVEAIDNFTKYTHENRYGVSGWKTNAGHLLNKKFIAGWIAATNFDGGLRVNDYGTNFERVIDLTKALCYITGTNFDDIQDVREVSLNETDDDRVKKYRSADPDRSRGLPYPSPSSFNRFQRNTWYQWGFFEFKLFKKGTGHFKFQDEKVWERLNRAYAKAKGQVLPEKL